MYHLLDIERRDEQSLSWTQAYVVSSSLSWAPSVRCSRTHFIRSRLQDFHFAPAYISDQIFLPRIKWVRNRSLVHPCSGMMELVKLASQLARCGQLERKRSVIIIKPGRDRARYRRYPGKKEDPGSSCLRTGWSHACYIERLRRTVLSTQCVENRSSALVGTARST